MSGTSYEFFIARRYLKSRSKTGFINLITYISILGVAIGVAALIIVLSVMNGFESEVRSRIIGFDSHIRLRTYHDRGIDNPEEIMEAVRGLPHITGLSPYILDKGMIRSKINGKSSGVIIRGADQKTISQVSELEKNMIYGEMNLGPVRPVAEDTFLPGIVVGRWLADRLFLDVGDRVFLISPAGMQTIFNQPPVKQFVVSGYFETDMYEYDDNYVYISIESAQELFRMGHSVSGIEIHLDDFYKAADVVKIIDDKLGYPYYALSWFDMRKNLFSWMQLEKWAMFIALSLIIIVAAFNIITTLIMVVMEKTKEIGILKSMGATSKSIMKVFVFEGLVVGVIGTMIGFLAGYALCWAQMKYQFFSLPGDVYFINYLPVQVVPNDFLFVGGAGILICLVAAVYPAYKAARLIPVEAIRYE